MFAVMLSAGVAMANGTLTATFLYNGSGVNQPLDHAYVYLQSGTKINPKEKYFSSPLLILGPTDANGNISASVPEGKYYVRFTRRAPLTSTPTQAQTYGRPNIGDYTWNYGAPVAPTITVTTGSVINLGTVYATLFGEPITVSGRVFKSDGSTPVPGAFVKATTQICQELYYNYCHSIQASGVCERPNGPTANCGTKYPAQNLTDANGNYTIKLKNPGTYYIYACSTPGICYGLCWQAVGGGGCSNAGGFGTGSGGAISAITVGSGQSLTGVNISGNF